MPSLRRRTANDGKVRALVSLSLLEVTCIICNVSHYWSREQNNEQKTILLDIKRNNNNNASADYQGPVKIEFGTGAGQLILVNGRTLRILTETKDQGDWNSM